MLQAVVFHRPTISLSIGSEALEHGGWALLPRGRAGAKELRVGLARVQAPAAAEPKPVDGLHPLFAAKLAGSEDVPS